MYDISVLTGWVDHYLPRMHVRFTAIGSSCADSLFWLFLILTLLTLQLNILSNVCMTPMHILYTYVKYIIQYDV